MFPVTVVSMKNGAEMFLVTILPLKGVTLTFISLPQAFVFINPIVSVGTYPKSEVDTREWITR